MGCWGEWSVEIPYEVDRDQFGVLIVWEFSAQDGSRIHIREYPVQTALTIPSRYRETVGVSASQKTNLKFD